MLLLVAGNLNTSRTGTIDSALGTDSSNKSRDKAMAGAQVKVIFDLPQVRAFVLFDAVTSIDSNITYFGFNSSSTLDNNWIMRRIIGVEIFPFYNNFSAGVDIGGALINQTVNSSLTITNIATTTHETSTSLEPSALASLTWLGCQTCVFGNGGSISLQIAADRSRVLLQAAELLMAQYLISM